MNVAACNHMQQTEAWITEEDDWAGQDTSHWETRIEYITVDLDTHRYKSLQCNKIMYYSGAAEEYYTTGVDRKGLFRK